MDPYWKNKNTIKIPNTNMTLSGYSIGGLRQVFYISDLDLLLDCGIATPFLPSKIFITHGHLDHASSLPQICLNGEGTTIYVPKPLASRLSGFMKAGYSMAGVKKDNYIINGVECGSIINEKMNARLFEIQIFRCFHSIPCIGYGFTEIRRKIKKEYIDLTQEEIIKLVKNKVKITEDIKYPLFCFLGDTNNKVFEQTDIFKYSTIICECTFYDEEDKRKAIKKKHTHINDLLPIIKEHENIFFILIHQSQKYKYEHIKEYVDGISNVMIWKN